MVKGLPWRPLLAAAGSTTHVIDPASGLVVEHQERWKADPAQVCVWVGGWCCVGCACVSVSVWGGDREAPPAQQEEEALGWWRGWGRVGQQSRPVWA